MTDYLAHHAHTFLVAVFRLCLWLAILAIIFVPLERLFALHPRRIFRAGIGVDLGYFFLSGLLPALLMSVPLAIAAWSVRRFIPHGLHEMVAEAPFWSRALAALVVGDIGYYWGHRCLHAVPMLWRFHSVHHSAAQIDFMVNTRAHPVDLVFTRLCGFIPMYVLGLAQPTGRALDLVTLLVILTGTLWGFFIHSNVNWRLGPLEWLISTPAFHHWHHTYEEPLNKNYSPMLPWVDRLFGTYHMPKAEWPSRYGAEAPVASGWADQLMQPLMPLRNETGVQLSGVRKAESEAIPTAGGGWERSG